MDTHEQACNKATDTHTRTFTNTHADKLKKGDKLFMHILIILGVAITACTECARQKNLIELNTRTFIYKHKPIEKEGNVLFNDALNIFYLRLYGVSHMVKDQSDREREETCCRHMGYSIRLAARVLLYAPSNIQYSTYHGLCYTSRGTLAGTRNSSMGPP